MEGEGRDGKAYADFVGGFGFFDGFVGAFLAAAGGEGLCALPLRCALDG